METAGVEQAMMEEDEVDGEGPGEEQNRALQPLHHWHPHNWHRHSSFPP